jgi:hypothetical protein
MNKENAHLFLPLLQALVDGKNLQVKSGAFGNSHWEDFDETEEIGFYDAPEYYRIKPEQPIETEYRFLKEGEIVQEARSTGYKM